MAMTKAEKQRLELAERERDLARSLRWSPPVSRDREPPAPGNTETMSLGWDVIVSTGRVYKAFSRSSSHGSGWPADDEPRWRRADSQGSLPLYSSELRALRSLRHDVVQECAKRLLDIDKRIEELEAADVDSLLTKKQDG